MRVRCFAVVRLAVFCGSLASPLAAQGGAPEADELRARVASTRTNLQQIAAIAERSARFLGFPSTSRFLIPRQFDPAFFLEFLFRAGGPPDTRDTGEANVAGLVLLPVRHWTGVGLGLAASVERWQAMQRPVVIIGPAAGRPAIALGGSFIDDGAPDGDRGHAAINGIANMLVGWTFYAEVVAAATRAGWQPGILVSVMAPDTSLHNADARFRMPGLTPPVVPATRLGAEYLDAVDSALAFAVTPSHRVAIEAAAERLRSARAAGHRVFVASCGHYLAEEIVPDTIASPFIPIDFRKGMAAELTRHGAAAHDIVVWFGYGGYDCPNAEVSSTFRTLGMDVVLITNTVPRPAPDELVAEIPLSWRIPDAVVDLPFAPWHMAPISSMEMALHYLWLRRLVAVPKQ